MVCILAKCECQSLWAFDLGRAHGLPTPGRSLGPAPLYQYHSAPYINICAANDNIADSDMDERARARVVAVERTRGRRGTFGLRRRSSK